MLHTEGKKVSKIDRGRLRDKTADGLIDGMRDSRHYGTVKDQDMTKINHHMMMIPVILCEYSLYDAYNQDKHFYVSVIQTGHSTHGQHINSTDFCILCSLRRAVFKHTSHTERGVAHLKLQTDQRSREYRQTGTRS